MLNPSDDVTPPRTDSAPTGTPADERIRLKERLLNLTQTMTHLGSWHLDIAANVLTWSDEVYRIFGLDPATFPATYEAFLHCVHPDDREMVHRAYQEAVANKAPYDIVHRILRPDGTVRIVRERSEDVFDEAGTVIYSFGIVHDITEQQRFQDQLQKAKTEWEQTFDAMPDIVTLMDKEFRIHRANKATFAFFNAKPSEIIGRFCHELFRNMATPCQDCPIFDTLHDASCHQRDKISHEALGKIFQVTSSPIFDSTGELKYLVHIARDITEVSKLQEDLFQAHKMEAIGALAGGIAHDFNNILTGIIGYSELARMESPEGSPSRQYLDQVLKAGDRARDLISQILTFCRKTPQQVSPMSPLVITKEVVKLLRASLPSTVAIKDSIDPACGSIMADPIQVHQILVNLCTNAFQAMPDQKGTLTITLGQTTVAAEGLTDELLPATGPLVKLEVADTGMGMEEATKRRIFEPYFTTKEPGKGTGMGLAVVHGIIKSHGGVIRVSSEKEKGSKFSVYFPVVSATTADSDHTHESVQLPTGNERILIVDDEESIGKMLCSCLEHQGYQVTVKTAALDALDEFQLHPDKYDLVITDQTMPHMTGAELAGILLQIRPGLPIILCTGYSSMISELEAKEVGIKFFVTKPLTAVQATLLARQALD